MEDSACDISPGRVSRDESESLWVWMKPAAFYNSLESRYQSNRIFLRRCLSYSRKSPSKNTKEGSVEVEFMDLVSNQQSPQGHSSSGDTVRKRPASTRLSVIAIICESDTDREFHPFAAKMVHLRGHDSVTISFNADDRPITLLMIVRGNHHDMSLLHSSRSMELSNEVTKKFCFGCVPVGEFVWWTSYTVTGTAKMRVNEWKGGLVTLGEKSIWDGSEQQQHKMLSIQRCPHTSSTATSPPSLFTLRVTARRPSTSKALRPVPSGERSISSTEGEVAFRFVYGVAHPQCVQQRTQDHGCPFCSIKCQDLLGLRYHLAASHDIFLYEVETGSLTVIWVRRRMEVYDESGNIFCPLTKQFMNSPEKAFYMNKAAFLRAKPVAKRRRSGAPTLSNFFDEFETPARAKRKTVIAPKPTTTSKVTARTGTRRSSRTNAPRLSDHIGRFYHSRTAIPMTEIEVREGIDTDEDEDLAAWETMTQRQLASIPAMDGSKTEFMFHWDRFVHDHIWPYADYKVPMSCKLFAWKEHQKLQELPFQRSFLDHLHALFMFKLIQQDDINACIEIVRSDKKGEKMRVAVTEKKVGCHHIMEKRHKAENSRSKLQSL